MFLIILQAVRRILLLNLAAYVKEQSINEVKQTARDALIDKISAYDKSPTNRYDKGGGLLLQFLEEYGLQNLSQSTEAQLSEFISKYSIK